MTFTLSTNLLKQHGLKSTWTLLKTENGNSSLIYNWRTTAAISFFRGNLKVSDSIKEIRATDPVNKENLEYWKEINFVDKVSSDIAFQEQVLLFNSVDKDR